MVKKKHLVGICFPQLLPLALFPLLYSYKALKYYSLSSMHGEIASECYDLEGGEFVEKYCVCGTPQRPWGKRGGRRIVPAAWFTVER